MNLKQTLRRVWVTTVGAGFCVLVAAAPLRAAVLQDINSPGGGHVAVGRLAGTPTERQVVRQIAGELNARYGGKPQLSRVLRGGGSGLVAALFSLQPAAGGEPLTGLAILSKSDGVYSAAVLTDSASHFRSSLKPMLQALRTQMTKQAAAGTGTEAGANSTPSVADSTAGSTSSQLVRLVSPDRIAVVSAPADWKLDSGRQGSIRATGPDGAVLEFGYPHLINDSAGRMAGTLSGHNISVPYNADPATALQSIFAQGAAVQHKAAPTWHIAKVEDIGRNGIRNYALTGTVDLPDGRGTMHAWVWMNWTPKMNAYGPYMITVSDILLPDSLMGSVGPLVDRISHSYGVNNRAQIAEIGSDVGAGEAITGNFIRTSQRSLDAMDRQTAAFADTLLDNSVVLDKYEHAHGRVDDDLASALVAADPDRYQVVNGSDYWKGIDY